ncbi:hypothetical protein DFH07DRAFT_930894 [Mycena maculata]|uniref:Protein kinase domain-containing protein n=1 Tax=Mycena maculata TaxID=230809 RepID=A0AAD7HSA6_9AGAR|nr:hypothetical protein DFH07DRAFT_896383 [Mycena maculata]KAJ7727134.1 hypothetical protein DFH07DRAFT_930894 [Mycena maculata]
MDQIILGGPLSHSPDNSDSESDSDSDSTLEDLDLYPTWAQGYPLQRVARWADRTTNASHASLSSSCSSDSSSTSSIVYDIDFEQLIDDLLAEEPFPLSETRNTVTVAASTSDANDSMMIKCLHRSSPELIILLRLNNHDLRQDPWNPAPHIICAISRDERVFLCMRRLVEFNQPPLQIVSNYIDFFKQVLEGLTFLHEHSIAQLSCLDLSTYWVDLGPTTSSASDSVEYFDRTRYPVRYYFTNLSNASEFESRADPAFQKDVEDCAGMMEHLAANVPSISRKLTALVNAMRTGTFDADASRKLFEALCKSLPADIFDIRVPPLPTLLPRQSSLLRSRPACIARTTTWDPRRR